MSSAAMYLNRASGIYMRSGLDATAEYAEVLLNTAGLHSKLGDEATALAILQRAAIIMKKTLPPDHPHLATLHSNIALSNAALGNTTAAAKARSEFKAVERRSQVACAGPGCSRKLKEDGTALTMCAACLRTHYCSVACQTADWKAGHKAECKALQRENAGGGK